MDNTTSLRLAPQTTMSVCCQPETISEPILSVRGLGVRVGSRQIISNVQLNIAPNQIFAIIGPSGAGKSTLLKCLNRLSDLVPELTRTGDVLFHGRSIYAPDQSPDTLRTRIGTLFQQPVLFPGSIYHNVLFGVRRLGVVHKKMFPEVAERALREAALWDEVKDRLRLSASRLSVGQQQRLCLARTLASEPEVILMDEPTSALDPKSTHAIEALMRRLKERHTIVMVTHNILQTRRVADWVGCMCVTNNAGELLETACCDQLLDQPQCMAVAEYLRHAH
jgi:phosphate transport system ATP-binding protein